MEVDTVRIFIGYDEREAVAYHTCVQSLIETSSEPLEIHPLALNNMERFYAERHTDGSNAFIYSRFLVPYLCGWRGYAIFLDGDMLVRSDIVELWKMRRADRALHVVQHDYRTKFDTKYLGNENRDYPRKNWSSVILWNCAFWPNRKLTPAFVASAPGSYLHRFEWLGEDQIEPLPAEWNHLTMEYPDSPTAKLLHYTIGTPCFAGYENQEGADEWYATLDRANAPLGEQSSLSQTIPISKQA